MAITAYIGQAALDRIDEEIAYYEGRNEDTMADELEEYLFNAIKKAAVAPHSYAAPPRFPRNYRRVIAKPYIIHYRINETASELTFYLIRHKAQRPLTRETHRKLAGEAERDRREL